MLYLKPYRVHYKIGPVIPRSWHGKSILQILMSTYSDNSNEQQDPQQQHESQLQATILQAIETNEILVDGFPISNPHEILVPAAPVMVHEAEALPSENNEQQHPEPSNTTSKKKQQKKKQQQNKQQQRQIQQLLQQHKEQQQHYIEIPVVRHEAPILAQELEFIYTSEQLLVINKPASIPAHATSSHYKCAATYLLERVYNMGKVFPIHRIDKHTSGVFMCARSSEEAQRLMPILLNKQETTKFYLARVRGDFSTSKLNEINSQAVQELSKHVIEVTAPLDTASQKLVRVDFIKGKPSKSVFYKVKYDQATDTTLLICHLFTGRTHQIRVHLQYLGYPIVNDCIYGNDAQLIKQHIKTFGEFAETSSVNQQKQESNVQSSKNQRKRDNIVDKYIELLQADEEQALTAGKTNTTIETQDNNNNDELVLVHQLQSLPKRYKKSTYTQFKELSNEDLEYYEKQAAIERKLQSNSEIKSTDCFVMRLHAWKYKLENKTYEAKAPKWALELVSEEALEEFFFNNISTQQK